MKPKSINEYNEAQSVDDRRICHALMDEIDRALPDAERKVWHAHPVWFINGNPIVGYSKLKGCIRLMFWSGADFGESGLEPGTGKFKDASIRYTSPEAIDVESLRRWLRKARAIQWDYKNVAKRKGRLVRLTPRGDTA